MAFVGPWHEPDRYELHEVVSRGADGEVWRGRSSGGGATVRVAVTRPLPGRAEGHREWQDRWSRQADTLCSSEHPALVTVREFFDGGAPHERGRAEGEGDGATLYLVMEWVEGPTLTEWVYRRADRDLLPALRLIGGLAAAVDHLHRGVGNGPTVLHRAIKPSNVIVTERGPVLVDFGFVEGGQTPASGSSATSTHFTAPEVTAGTGTSGASDRYALGATAFFALTGEVPEVADLAGLYAVLDRVPGLEGRRDVQDHLLSMLNPEPSHRPASAVGWAQTLASVIAARPATSSAAQVAPVGGPSVAASTPATAATGQVPPRPRERRLVTVLGGVLALALVGGGAAFALRSGTPDDASAAAAVVPVEGAEDATDDPHAADDVEVPDDPVVLPDLAGVTVAEATEQLEALGLDVAVVEEESAGAAGRILAQRPRAGSEVDPGDRVTLTASRRVDVPDVVGMQLGEARQLLRDLGASVEVITRFDRSIAADTVLEQSSPAGSALDDEIALTVSEGAAALYLERLRSVAVDGDVDSGVRTDIDGQTYLRSVAGEVRSGWRSTASIEYNLSRDFDALVATLGYQDDQPADGRVRFEVFADNRKVYEQDLGLGTAIDLDLDTTGVLRLRLEWTLLSGDRGLVALGEPQLLADPAVIERYEREADDD
jgi:hypothetical protein